MSFAGGAERALDRYLWLFKLEVLPVLNGAVDVLQDDVDAFIVGAVKRQEANHAVVVNLNRGEREIWIGQRELQIAKLASTHRGGLQENADTVLLLKAQSKSALGLTHVACGMPAPPRRVLGWCRKSLLTTDPARVPK